MASEAMCAGSTPARGAKKVEILMKILGISAVVSNDNPAAISELWHRFYTEKVSDKIPRKISYDVVSVYTHYQGDHTKPYSVILGYEVGENEDILPDGLKLVSINNENHTRYTVTGKLPDVVIQKWTEIWNSGRKRAYIADYDIHHADGSVDIHVQFCN